MNMEDILKENLMHDQYGHPIWIEQDVLTAMEIYADQQTTAYAKRVEELEAALREIEQICEHDDFGEKAENCPVCIARKALSLNTENK